MVFDRTCELIPFQFNFFNSVNMAWYIVLRQNLPIRDTGGVRIQGSPRDPHPLHKPLQSGCSGPQLYGPLAVKCFPQKPVWNLSKISVVCS